MAVHPWCCAAPFKFYYGVKVIYVWFCILPPFNVKPIGQNVVILANMSHASLFALGRHLSGCKSCDVTDTANSFTAFGVCCLKRKQICRPSQGATTLTAPSLWHINKVLPGWLSAMAPLRYLLALFVMRPEVACQANSYRLSVCKYGFVYTVLRIQLDLLKNCWYWATDVISKSNRSVINRKLGAAYTAMFSVKSLWKHL